MSTVVPGLKEAPAKRNTASAGWTQPVAVGAGGFPQAALSSAGNVTVVWSRLLPRPKFGAVIDAVTDPTG